VRLSEQRDDTGFWVLAAYLEDLGGSVAIASGDLAQVATRHAVKAIDAFAELPAGAQQFQKRLPGIPPIVIEADPVAQLTIVDLTGQPLVEDVLVAGEDGLDRQHHRSPGGCGLAQQRHRVTLGSRQGMVVPDQENVCRLEFDL
jgi:hypothetical protein